jgi:hypothetical protein
VVARIVLFITHFYKNNIYRIEIYKLHIYKQARARAVGRPTRLLFPDKDNVSVGHGQSGIIGGGGGGGGGGGCVGRQGKRE